jgi:hypothetical protein
MEYSDNTRQMWKASQLGSRPCDPAQPTSTAEAKPSCCTSSSENCTGVITCFGRQANQWDQSTALSELLLLLLLLLLPCLLLSSAPLWLLLVLLVAAGLVVGVCLSSWCFMVRSLKARSADQCISRSLSLCMSREGAEAQRVNQTMLSYDPITRNKGEGGLHH